jgi:hypothetical protein
VDAVGAPHVGERTEKQLITALCDKIAELCPHSSRSTATASTCPCCATGQWSTVYPRRDYRRVPTFTGTPRMPSICVTSSRPSVPRARPLFTRSAE